MKMLEYKGNQALLAEIKQGRVLAMEGANFSGRTDLLRRLTGLESQVGDNFPVLSNGRPNSYIGPEIYNSLSAFAPTVKEELILHAGCLPEHSHVAHLVEETGLNHLFERNPFTLSGGEQAILAITSALSIKPGALALDCSLEQVDLGFKLALLRQLGGRAGEHTSTILADNCLSEFSGLAPVYVAPMAHIQMKPLPQPRFEPIKSDLELGIGVGSPCSLTLDGLSFGYQHGKSILNNVSVQLEPGTLYVLEGRNGAGKSTFAKLMCGVLNPESGHFRINDIEFQPWKQPGRLVAYHFQNPDVQLFSTSVMDEILAGPKALRLGETECRRRTDAVITAFGLSRLCGEHPLDLPFVIRKRIALAATLAMGCPWIILDEPTLGQDRTSAGVIAHILTNLLRSGVGIIVISHSESFRKLLPAVTLRLENGTLCQ